MVCALCAGWGTLTNAGAQQEATPGAAASYSIVGNWGITGKATVSANFAGIVTVSLTLPNFGILGDVFVYDSSNNFSDTVLGMTGTYTQSGNNFTVDLSAWVESLQEEVLALLSEYGITATVTVTKQSFTGKVTSATKSSGQFTINIAVTSPVSGTVSLAGTLSGTKLSTAGVAGSTQTPQSLAKILFEKVLQPVLGVPAQ